MPANFQTTYKEPYIEWIRADTLKPWRLQRLLNNNAVRRMADEWNMNTFGFMIVSRHGTRDELLDGQHRWVTITREFGAGHQKFPCLVYEDLTDAQECEIFHSQGPLQRKSISGIHDAHILYEAGDPSMIALYNLCQEAGVLLTWHNSKQENTTIAVATLRSLAKKHGPGHVSNVLETLRDAIGPDQKAYSGRMLDGMSAFLVRYQDHEYYDRKQFAQRLQTVSPEGVEREANKLAAELGVRNESANIGRAFHRLYNLRRSVRRLPAWEANVTSPLATDHRVQGLAQHPSRANGRVERPDHPNAKARLAARARKEAAK